MDIVIILKLSLSVLFGAIIGFEREYRSKAAGFRTITMITLGSALFTILSFKFGSAVSQDRIAANVVVGIGFLGAGVIFKEGFGVSGLTTAATIWVSAAIGMATGLGEYAGAFATLVLSLIILSFFERIQDVIESFHQVRTYRIGFAKGYHVGKKRVEDQLHNLDLKYKIRKILQEGDEVSFVYQISGNHQRMDEFTEFLLGESSVQSFDE